MHHVQDSSLLLPLIFPTQYNKSIKAPFTHDGWNYITQGVESCGKYSIWFCVVLYLPFNPAPHTVFLYITCNGALIDSYILFNLFKGELQSKKYKFTL